MLFKKAILAIFVAVCLHQVLASQCGPGPTHSFTYGRRVKGDELLFMDIPTFEGHFFREVTASVQYPLPDEQKEGYITYMEVVDKYTGREGGCAYVRSGGVGQSSVEFFLQSQRGEGMKFVIRVYGIRRQI